MTALRLYLAIAAVAVGSSYADDQEVAVPSVAPSVNEDFFAFEETSFPTLAVAPSPVPTAMTEEEEAVAIPSVYPTFDDWDLAEETFGPTMAEIQDPTLVPTLLTEEEVIETLSPTVLEIKETEQPVVSTTAPPTIEKQPEEPESPPVNEPTVPVDEIKVNETTASEDGSNTEIPPGGENTEKSVGDLSLPPSTNSDDDMNVGVIMGSVLGVGAFLTVILGLWYWRSNAAERAGMKPVDTTEGITDRKDEEEGGVVEVKRVQSPPARGRPPKDDPNDLVW